MTQKYTSNILLKRLQGYAFNCQQLAIRLPKNAHNRNYCSQLIRSSSSPGSNYIEAVEASTRKEFIYRLKLCRKECKESKYWLELIKKTNVDNEKVVKESERLIKEANELIKIFSASIITAEKRKGDDRK